MKKFKRLQDASAYVLTDSVPAETGPVPISGQLIRTAILCHSGPEGEALTLQSSDGEITFDAKRIQTVVDNQNALINEMAIDYGGFDKIPLGAFPPILDQHADDSNNRIRGRLAAPCRFEIRDVPKVGKNVACIVTEITFLGAEAIEQVLDGRIYHLSIGIDENTDTLGETSTVIEPAAPGAMLLKKGKEKIQQQEKKMKLTKKQLEAKHLKSKTARLAALSTMKDAVKNLSSKNTELKARVNMVKNEGAVSSRLSKLMASGKLSPAEVQKMDIKKLAKLDSETLETVVGVLESRQPVIIPGQKGSTDAVAFTQLGASMKDKEKKNLKNEIRAGLKKLGANVKMEKEDEKDEKWPAKKKDMAKDEDEEDKKLSDGDESEMKKHMASLEKNLEEGKMDDAKKSLEEMKKFGAKKLSRLEMGDVDSEQSSGDAQELSDVQTQIDEIQTNMARMASMIEELLKSEDEEEDGEEDSSEDAKDLSDDAEEGKDEKKDDEKKEEKTSDEAEA